MKSSTQASLNWCHHLEQWPATQTNKARNSVWSSGNWDPEGKQLEPRRSGLLTPDLEEWGFRANRPIIKRADVTFQLLTHFIATNN